MKPVGRLWVIERQQCICLAQSYYRDDKTHVGKYPADQRGEGPKHFMHQVITNYKLLSRNDAVIENKLRRLRKHDLAIFHCSDTRQ